VLGAFGLLPFFGFVCCPRVLFSYMSLKHFLKFSSEVSWRGFGAIVEPGEQKITAGRARPRNVSFPIGTNLANVA
jgi:hypothetical protein